MSSEGLSGDSECSVSSREDLSVGESEGSVGGGSEGSEEESEGDGVAVAQPPRLSSRATEHEIALTGSAALDALDQLLASNQIGKETAAKLRRKYNLLVEMLESSRALENSLLVQAKELGQQLSQQRRVLERSASFPEGHNSEASRLRQAQLTHQNELDQARERLEKLQREVEIHEEERDEVKREYDRFPKKEELEHHRREIQRQAEELSDEISMRSQDAQRYREELDRKNYKISTVLKEMEELKLLEERLQEELIAIRTGPNIPKELDALHKQKKEKEERIRNQNEFLEELKPQIAEVEGHTQEVIAERTGVMVELERERAEQKARSLDLERLGKDLATAKEREATLLEDRATLELQWKHRGGEHRTLFEAISAKNKEKDRELKLLKKAELQLGILQQSVDQQLRRRCVGLEARVKEGTEGLEGRRVRREEVRAEVEQLRKGLAQTEGVEEQYHTAVETRYALEQQLKNQVRRQQALLHDLNRDVVTVTKSRDHDAREYYKTRRQQHTIANHLRTQEGEEGEQRKRLRELEGQLRDFAEAYEVVKAERNKTHAQIQVMQQLGAELREKTKILQNEIEILVTSAENKEKLLQKCSLVQASKILERDSQRQELANLRLSQAELNSALEGQRDEIHRLTQQINTLEQQLNRLRRHYEQAVQERNDLGLQLIERNEEVCVFYERQNVSDGVLRKANMELSAREDELRFLRMELSKLQNDVLVKRKALPEKTKLVAELTTAQVELKVCEEELRRLEHSVECPSDPTRLRSLPGENPSCNELRERIERLESQLAESEQQLLEKELLHEQVGRLVERVGKRVEGGREGTLQVAKRVSHYQARIKETTRRMMAAVSELSMQQASALRLQQELKRKEEELEHAYGQLEVGKPPSEQAEREWEREVRVERRRTEEAHTRKRLVEEEESHLLPGGTLTTADPRPNAYFPSGEADLPLPKPYGSHAPFKPSQPGANMRHIRKPQPKPIDI